MLPPGLTEGVVLRLIACIGGALLFGLIVRRPRARKAPAPTTRSAKPARRTLVASPVWRWLAAQDGWPIAALGSLVVGLLVGPGLAAAFPDLHRRAFPDGREAIAAYEAEGARIRADIRALRDTGVSTAGVDEQARIERKRLTRARVYAKRSRWGSMIAERTAIAAVGFAITILVAWRRQAVWAVLGALILTAVQPGARAWGWVAVTAIIVGVALRESLRGWDSWGRRTSAGAFRIGGCALITLIASRLEPGSPSVSAIIVAPIAAALAGRVGPLAWAMPIGAFGWLWLGGPEAHPWATVGAVVLVALAGNPLTRS